MTHQIQQEIQELHQNLGKVTQALNQLHQTEHSNAQELHKLHQICSQLDQSLHQISSMTQQPLNQMGSSQFGSLGTQQFGSQSWNTQQSGWAQPSQQQFRSMGSQFTAPQYAQPQSTNYQHTNFSNMSSPTQTGFSSGNQYVPPQQQSIASSHSYTGPVYAGRTPEGIRERQFKQQEQPQYNMQHMQGMNQQTLGQQSWNQPWNQQHSASNLQGSGDQYGRVEQHRIGQQPGNQMGQSSLQQGF